MSTSTTSSATPTLKEQFQLFSKFGDSKSDGTTITLSQSDKWMKQAKVFESKAITTTDTGIHFKKFKSLKITFENFYKFLDDLATTKKVPLSDIEQKLVGCGAPGVPTMALSSKAGNNVDRMTDTSKYTGAHKLRFDESGKGQGGAGRRDEVDKSGYVTGYHNKDTYPKKD